MVRRCELGDQDPILIGGSFWLGQEAPMRYEFSAFIDPQGEIRVADINSEKHETERRLNLY
jgi:hypothetical protein